MKNIVEKLMNILREEYKIKDREPKIWQEPGFAVLILAGALLLVGYLIGVSV